MALNVFWDDLGFNTFKLRKIFVLEQKRLNGLMDGN